MSRIGKTPIGLKPAVKIEVSGQEVTVSGPKGELKFTLPEMISLEITENLLTVKSENEARQSKAYWGLSRSLLQSMVIGVTDGFKKDLEIVGVGYRGQVKGKQLILNLGYSNPVEFDIPSDVTVTMPSNTKISIEGIDKQRVGQVAATIRRFRQPDAYKGKGVRYAGERISLKEGKRVS